MNEQTKMNNTTAVCEGNCLETHGAHKGEVIPVICRMAGHSYRFNYCEQAIEEDTLRGFDVIPVDESPSPTEPGRTAEGIFRFHYESFIGTRFTCQDWEPFDNASMEDLKDCVLAAMSAYRSMPLLNKPKVK